MHVRSSRRLIYVRVRQDTSNEIKRICCFLRKAGNTVRRIGGKGRRREIARFCSSDSRKWPDYASTDDETNLQTLSLRQANRHREARNDYTTQRSDFLYADYLIATCFFFLCKRLLSAASVKEYDGCVITTIIEISSVNTQRNYGKNTFNLDVLLYLHRYKYH